MNIAICIPFYLRGHETNEAYRVTFKYYASLGYTLHLCGSEGEFSRNFAKPFLSDKVKYFEVPQDSFCKHSAGDDALRKKFNDSLQTLRKSGEFKWYCLAGADDIIPASFFERLEISNSSRIAMAGVASNMPLLIVGETGANPFRCVLQYDVQLLPGVNCFSWAAMEFCKDRPYRSNGCETGAERYFNQFGYITALAGHVIMVKGRSVLNTVQKIKLRHKTHPCTPYELDLIAQHLD